VCATLRAMTDLDSVREYLAAPRCAVLSTLDAQGAPHQTVVHYFLEAAALVVNGRPDRLWVRHLRRDPRVSLVVHDDADYLHWVGIKGTARVRHEGQAAVDDAMNLARRYSEDPEDFRHLQRVTLEVVPQRVFESRG
jgi:PPOX class probable F420-dependent enzyme